VNGQKITTTATDCVASLHQQRTGYGAYFRATVDVQFPNGVYDAESGELQNVTVNLTSYLYEVANDGSSETLIGSTATTVTRANREPYTISIYIDCSTYTFRDGYHCEVRVKRATAESPDFAIAYRCVMIGAGIGRALATPTGHSYVWFAAEASDKLNGDVADKLNVTVTRKLYTWDGDEWTPVPVETRSIAWALADICKSTVYGMGLDDSHIDLDALLALDAIWDARGDYFDGVFDQTITSWEALQKGARVGRAIPVLSGGRVTFVRDGVKTVRSAVFNPSNIAPGSLTIQYAFRQDSEPDGVDLTYIDTETWNEETVTVAIPGLVGDPVRPQKVNLFGCTDVDQATREATYLARRMAYMRKTITWQTEMDGRLLTVGDMVAVAHDIPAWSQSAECVAYYDLSGPSRWDTSQDLISPNAKEFLAKRPDGTAWASFVQSSGAGYIVVQDTPDFTPNTNLENGDRTTFIIYDSAVPQDMVITDISPSGDTSHTITAVPYDARIHASGA